MTVAEVVDLAIEQWPVPHPGVPRAGRQRDRHRLREGRVPPRARRRGRRFDRGHRPPGVLRARDQAGRGAVGGDAGPEDPHGRRGRRVRRHVRTGHARGPARGVGRRDPRRVRHRRRADRTTALGEVLVNATINVATSTRSSTSTCPTTTGTRSAASCSAPLGRVPAVGDEVEVDGARLVVERVDGRRVSRVLIAVADAEVRDDEPERRSDPEWTRS